MVEAIVWIGAIVLVILMFWALIHEQTRRANRTDEEYQKDATGEASLLSQGMMALDQIAFRPQAKAAIEYRQDKLRGQTADNSSAGEDISSVKTSEKPTTNGEN